MCHSVSRSIPMQDECAEQTNAGKRSNITSSKRISSFVKFIRSSLFACAMKFFLSKKKKPVPIPIFTSWKNPNHNHNWCLPQKTKTESSGGVTKRREHTRVAARYQEILSGHRMTPGHVTTFRSDSNEYFFFSSMKPCSSIHWLFFSSKSFRESREMSETFAWWCCQKSQCRRDELVLRMTDRFDLLNPDVLKKYVWLSMSVWSLSAASRWTIGEL